MGNRKRFLVVRLLLAALHVCFLQSACSIVRISNQYAIPEHPTEKNFKEPEIQKGLWSSLAVGAFAYPAYNNVLLLSVSHDKCEGNFTTVQAAIDAVPMYNTQLVLIDVKPGIYREKVKIAAEKPFIILTGSGANKTIITWNDSAISSGGTPDSATFSAFASDFIARDITFQNAYGPGAPAVALLVTGDRSAFYRCKFLGYQDTLLDDHGTHYFNHCFIEGAADYICGDGKSLYQNCHINAIPQQNGAITAQKRSSPSEDTGFIFVNCRIKGRGLMFLGRPWGSYSRVVFAYTQIDDIIYPQGWDNWGEPYTDNTVFYAQYKCYGPGANTTRRAPWSLNLTPAQAEPFLSKRFIGGNMWMRKLPYLMRMVTKLIHQKG